LSKFHIQRDGKTVIKTSDPAKAAQYKGRAGYRILTIPVTR
jgi:hypothetical protein